MSALRRAVARLRTQRRRAAGAALLTLAGGLAVGVAGSVAFALATGYDRAADRTDQPDVQAQFEPQRRSELDARLRRLPNVAALAYRFEVSDVRLAANGRRDGDGAVNVVEPGRRGYAVVEGRDLSDRPGEVLVDRGVANEWDLEPGDAMRVGRLGALRIAGIALSVDNVAFPLATVPKVYVTTGEVDRRFGRQEPAANVALVWLADRDRLDVTLAAARPAIFGLRSEGLLTRRGVRQVIDQAAGIVIALLSVFALVAAACAGAMLAASAGAEVRRRAPVLGVHRALGASRGQVVGEQALDAVLVAAPAAALGLTTGALAAAPPTATLLGYLNELGPGAALAGPLAGAFVLLVAGVAAGSAWPAWRLNRRPIAALLRGGDLDTGAGTRRRGAAPRPAGRGPQTALPAPPARHRPAGGLPALGARFAVARRGRWLASVAVLGVAGAAVLLVLAVADLLVSLRDDPGTLGRRYALTVPGDRGDIREIDAIEGVEAAAQRSEIQAADSFSLTEPLRVIAYPGDHVAFEAPPLASGRRARSAREVEVGLGTADALGLRPGSTLAIQPANSRELRFRVTGVVRALDNGGRVVYARTAPFRRDDPGLGGPIAVVVEDGADQGEVAGRLARAGFANDEAAGATTQDRDFLAVLATVLRAVAMAIGLVCLAAIAQTLALTARDRRRALAVLRASGAPALALGAVLAGAAAALVIPALLAALALQRLVLGPIVADLAADYATLPLGASLTDAALVGGGLALVAAIAVVAVAHAAVREPVAEGLERED